MNHNNASDLSNVPAIATPDILAQRYAFCSELGCGASGKMYKAYDKLLGKDVAIKAIKFRADFKTLELFEREAETMRSINIEGVPKYGDFIVNPDNPDEAYIVQEFVAGNTLQALIERQIKRSALPHLNGGTIDDLLDETAHPDLWQPLFSLGEIKKILADIAKILLKLETEYVPPIIHRDIKPSNIIFSQGRYWLIDFGAVANPQRKSANSTIAGTQGYMAPEQLLGECCVQSDFYGLGATILHAVTGVAPIDFPCDTFDRLYAPYLDRFDLTPDISELVKKMLALRAEDRVKSADCILAAAEPQNKNRIKYSDDPDACRPIDLRRNNAAEKMTCGELLADKFKKESEQNPEMSKKRRAVIFCILFGYYFVNTIASCLAVICGGAEHKCIDNDKTRYEIGFSRNRAIAGVFLLSFVPLFVQTSSPDNYIIDPACGGSGTFIVLTCLILGAAFFAMKLFFKFAGSRLFAFCHAWFKVFPKSNPGLQHRFFGKTAGSSGQNAERFDDAAHAKATIRAAVPAKDRLLVSCTYVFDKLAYGFNGHILAIDIKRALRGLNYSALVGKSFDIVVNPGDPNIFAVCEKKEQSDGELASMVPFLKDAWGNPIERRYA